MSMASNPPFQVEDQTDEDFFDKLVNDDDDDNYNVDLSSSALEFGDGNDLDEAKAFADLDDSGGENGSGAIVRVVKTASVVSRTSGSVSESKVDEISTLLSSAESDHVVESNEVMTTSTELPNLAVKSSLDTYDVIKPDNDIKGTMMVPDLSANKSAGSGSSGIKEVQWSAFDSDALPNGVTGVESYSDIFGEFGDGEKIEESLTTESNVVYGSAYSDNTHSYYEYQDGQVNAAEPNGQDMNNVEYWENLYPGWKYDQNTGQWYQVDGYDATTSVEGSSSEVSYLQQASQSGVGTVLQNGTTESVTNWNHSAHLGETTDLAFNCNQVTQTTDGTESVSNWNRVSLSNNGYPLHMYFDPQFPGWYYDTIVQEWRTLDSYMSSIPSAVQSENPPNQYGFASANTSLPNDQETQGMYGQVGNVGARGHSHQNQGNNWSGTFTNYKQQDSNMWQHNSACSSLSASQKLENQYDQKHSLRNHVSHQNSYHYEGTVAYNEKASQSLNEFSAIYSGNFTQQHNQPEFKKNEHIHTSNNYYSNHNVACNSQPDYQSASQFSYAQAGGRSTDGRPSHALVSFGFGGKLIMMKDNNGSIGNTSYGGQVHVGRSIYVHNLMEVVSGRPDALSSRPGVCDYFDNLCRQSIPGPLTGGNVSAKELYRWTDERIANCGSQNIDYRKAKVLRLLLSLLRIALQYYGKLRSPFGTNTVSKETDCPESAVAKLFASAKGNDSDSRQYAALAYCLQKLPSEAQIRATAVEVQTLLVSGRKQEALCCAQKGHLWGPALVLAAQLGDQFYVDTVKQMALHQLVLGSPLRTLCLLIAGQPAEVFSAQSGADGNSPNVITMSPSPAQVGTNRMLDDWEENLAVITANRTKDDELVLVHLGDCLWKERTEIVAAHICYLVAEANFEPYSDSARLCLVGADHFKFPRTYASPEAIQLTEIYEYSKLLGNSQFILLPFQPYKLVYAYMLAELGRVSDALKYCQAVIKSLKTGRASEVETWRLLASSLEERIKIHQQGGFSTNLAPAKLVGKLLNLFDSTAHRVVGNLPPAAPSRTSGNIQGNEHYYQSMSPRVLTSQSTMAMSSLIPSTSMEPINEWTADGNRRTIRSISEPDFSRSPKKDQVDSSNEASSTKAKGKASVSGGTSRFGRFGSQFLQKILKPRQDKQAKLGETNKFYYDEKLKRWVEEGVDPPAEEAALPPPPTIAAFPNGTSDYKLNSSLKSEGPRTNGSPEHRSQTSLVHSSGIPPISPASNQFSARGRTGVRSRYVDTFNKGGGNQTNMFHSPSVPSVKPKSNASPKFFVPASASSQTLDSAADGNRETTSGNLSSMSDSVQSFAPPSSMNMQRFASMDDIANKRSVAAGIGNGSPYPHARRASSWSGSIAESFSPPSKAETKPLGEVLGMPPSLFMPTSPALMHSSANDGSYSSDLHELEF